MAINLSFMALILVLVPMFYLLLACPAFLFVRLDILQVARLLRAMFHGYFIALIGVAVVAVGLTLLDDKSFGAVLLAALCGFAILWRRWLLTRFDHHLAALPREPAQAATALRHLHLIGMGANAIQVAAVLMLIPRLITSL
jgi:hypothetical protein